MHISFRYLCQWLNGFRLSFAISRLRDDVICQVVWNKDTFSAGKTHLINSFTPSAAYMRQWTGSALAQIMACRLFGAKPLSKPVLGYCQLQKLQWVSIQDSKLFLHENASENIVCKIAAILSRGRWVKDAKQSAQSLMYNIPMIAVPLQTHTSIRAIPLFVTPCVLSQHERLFARHSNLMETSSCCYLITVRQIATIFCACHDSTVFVLCRKSAEITLLEFRWE